MEKTKKKVKRREETKRTEAEGKRVKGILSTIHYMSKLSQELKEQLLTGLNGLVGHFSTSPPLLDTALAPF